MKRDTHVEVFEQGGAICVREPFRSGDPKVRQKPFDVQQDRIPSLFIVSSSHVAIEY